MKSFFLALILLISPYGFGTCDEGINWSSTRNSGEGQEIDLNYHGRMKETVLPHFGHALGVDLNEDDGWTSAGGGEFVKTKHNPWFLESQLEPKGNIQWCVNHQEKFFSLNKRQAIQEASQAIREISHQFKKSKLHLKSGKLNLKFRTTFSMVEDCEKADLEIILGNYDHPKIQTLVQNYGNERLKTYAGLSIRTFYNSKTLNSKGFIFIAADKGDNTYSGNLRYELTKEKRIWNRNQFVDKNFPCPLPCNPQFALEKNVISPLRAVLSHELGHVFGLRHRTFQKHPFYNLIGQSGPQSPNLMDVNMPADTLARGYIRSDIYKNHLNLFEYSIPVSAHKNLYSAGEAFHFHQIYKTKGSSRLGKLFGEYFALQLISNGEGKPKGKISKLTPRTAFQVCGDLKEGIDADFRDCYSKVVIRGKSEFSFDVLSSYEFSFSLESKDPYSVSENTDFNISIPVLRNIWGKVTVDKDGNLIRQSDSYEKSMQKISVVQTKIQSILISFENNYQLKKEISMSGKLTKKLPEQLEIVFPEEGKKGKIILRDRDNSSKTLSIQPVKAINSLSEGNYVIFK